MLPIFWSAPALDDLDRITDHIAEFDVYAAITIHELIESAVHPVADHPYIFKRGRVPGTREIVAHPNYIVIYRVQADYVEVLSVLHARQEYPPRTLAK
ncbi:type II toxin-antitoxin system RelE/ParE family toxin [Bordetella flabilis]|uniref:Addiction module antitoxin n=1 Tax=Bordetella flabilis TaxID=463014 RepID=A0A193GLU3_9BORD|nr:type II toxin-antitoxin system RelE/ParE family toxin [Bordetella flabilis]ANN80840.1 addiction module antitoxin [Bordetella flabilis]